MRNLNIAIANNRNVKRWTNTVVTWDEFVERLRKPLKSPETYKEYLALKKAQQDNLKDVGGFVGGILKDGVRKNTHLVTRDIITLDFDNIKDSGEVQKIIENLNLLDCTYVVYSTRKHSPEAPRLRACLPLDRSVLPDEYEPLARKLAEYVGLVYCDPTTFQACRLMYFPSVCRDGVYEFTTGEGEFVSADLLLGKYADWKDINEWPKVPHAPAITVKPKTRQAIPADKSGIVGVFCRCFNIFTAIEEFLPDTYEPVDGDPNRFTFVGGSTIGGAIVYDEGQFLFSHHATDPVSGKLVNAFDLVRLHKFGDLDVVETAFPSNLPSFRAMVKFAHSIDKVKTLNATERMAEAGYDFEGVPDANFTTGIIRNDSGIPIKTINNVLYVLENDPKLRGVMCFDSFAHRARVLVKPPWSRETEFEGRLWNDSDESGLISHLETYYRFKDPTNVVKSAIRLWSANNKYHPIQNYLNGLVWDGTERLERLFVEYLGAEDCAYVRKATRMWFIGAVRRIFKPGYKFDSAIILSGKQGDGKTSLLITLGKGWTLEGMNSFKGKEALEKIQGRWIVELGELGAITKSTLEDVKQFMTTQVDFYRMPYDRNPLEFPRSCVFAGTTNDSNYLTDTAGGRRFWPIDTGLHPNTKSYRDLHKEVDQIWAEAVELSQTDERVYIDADDEEFELFQTEQELHREQSIIEPLVLEFLDRKIPDDWIRRDLVNRKNFWMQPEPDPSLRLVTRDKICKQEIYFELLDGEMGKIPHGIGKELDGIIKLSGKWEKMRAVSRFGYIGVSRGYSRILHR